MILGNSMDHDRENRQVERSMPRTWAAWLRLPAQFRMV